MPPSLYNMNQLSESTERIFFCSQMEHLYKRALDLVSPCGQYFVDFKEIKWLLYSWYPMTILPKKLWTLPVQHSYIQSYNSKYLHQSLISKCGIKLRNSSDRYCDELFATKENSDWSQEILISVSLRPFAFICWLQNATIVNNEKEIPIMNK